MAHPSQRVHQLFSASATDPLTQQPSQEELETSGVAPSQAMGGNPWDEGAGTQDKLRMRRHTASVQGHWLLPWQHGMASACT